MFNLPNLFLPKKAHFGLSIGRVSIRGVEVNRQGKAVAFAEMRLPESTFDSGVLVKKDVFVQALKQLLVKGKFSTAYVSVCFSEIFAYTREYQLPQINQEDIYEAISWHIQELFPYPPKEIYYDWRLLETNANGFKVAVVAVQKQILDPLIESLLAANLKPLSCEPGTSAIARLLVLGPTDQVLITEINSVGAYVTLVIGGRAHFTTVVNITAGEPSKNYFTHIINTVNEVTNFYKNKGILVEKSLYVLLTGELANDEWAKAVADQCPFAVKILKTASVDPTYNKAYAAALTKAETASDHDTINLLPDQMKQQYSQQRSRFFYTSLFTRIGVLFTILCLCAVGVFTAVRLEKQTLEGRIKKLQQNNQTQGAGVQKLLLLNANAQNIITLAPLRKTPKDKLAVIASILPQEVTVKDWEYDDSKLQFSLNGIAQSRQQLLLFKEKLTQTGEFTKIALPLGSLEAAANVRFNLTFTIK